MRTRKEIEDKSWVGFIVQDRSTWYIGEWQKLILEVLLDIRDLLAPTIIFSSDNSRVENTDTEKK